MTLQQWRAQAMMGPSWPAMLVGMGKPAAELLGGTLYSVHRALHLPIPLPLPPRPGSIHTTRAGHA